MLRSVSGRLLALVLVPSVAVTVLFSNEISRRNETRAAAGATTVAVEGLANLLELRFVLGQELFPTIALSVAPAVGSSYEEISRVIGRDLTVDVAAARARTDEVLAESATVDQQLGISTSLADLRQRFDAVTARSPLVYGTFQSLILELDEVIEAASDDALETIYSAEGLEPVRAAVEQLLLVYSAVSAGAWQLPNLVAADVQLTVDLGLANPDAALGAATGIYRSASAKLDHHLTGQTAARWQEILADADSQAFEQYVDEVLDGTPLNIVADATKARRLTDVGLARVELQFAVLNDSTDQVRLAAQAVEADAEAARIQTLWWLVALVLGMVGSAVLVGRSISRPLRRLAATAARVSRGDLEHETPLRRGPGEVRTVALAVEGLVANLRLIDRQAQALSAERLDDPALREPLPGALGASLHTTVRRLTDSIAERTALHRQLAHDARHDALTGLPNRSAILASITAAAERADRSGRPFAVLFIDLDHFKAANDEYGHEAGDEVLRQTARRMRQAARVVDVVARLGGDEFIIVAEELTSAEDVLSIGRRVIEAVSEPIVHDDHPIRIGASVGIAIGRSTADDLDELIRRADLAVYRAKASGRGTVAVDESTFNVFDDHPR